MAVEGFGDVLNQVACFVGQDDAQLTESRGDLGVGYHLSQPKQLLVVLGGDVE